METPIAQALLVCEHVITDETTKRKSLINILNDLRAVKFPVRFPRISIFATLTNGSGTMPFELQCVKADDNTQIFSMKGPITFPNPNDVVECIFSLKNFGLNAPGVYSFDLYCNDELLLERRVTVKQISPPQPPQPPTAPPSTPPA